MKVLLVLCLAALHCPCPPICDAIPDTLTVSVTGGLARGKLGTKGTIQFLGLPYASAQRYNAAMHTGPGDRFQVPSATVTSWTGVRNATAPGPQCPQQCPPLIRALYCLPDTQISESCLTLNIYRPAVKLPSGQLFPVMVFIHGGSFETGSGGAPLYNGDFLARTGRLLVVTINYRLGALGFLPIFNDYDDVISNFGLLDQQMALKWVQQNIAAFDGDPNKVTLLGAEAGCLSVAHHFTSPATDPFFQAAVFHSCPFTLPVRGKNESRQLAQDFAAALTCPVNDLDCFRRKSVEEILQAQAKVKNTVSARAPSFRRLHVWGPAVDMRHAFHDDLMHEVANSYLRPLASGVGKPVMLGVVAQEGEATVYHNYPRPVPSTLFQRLLEAEMPEVWRRLAETPGAPYRPANSADARKELSRFLNDFLYACPARRVAALLSTHDQRDVWMYQFDPKVVLWPRDAGYPAAVETYCQDKACQGLDLLYLFNPAAAFPDSRRQQTTEGLSLMLSTYWSNFAKYFNPNGPQPTTLAAPLIPGKATSPPDGSPSVLVRTKTLTDKLPYPRPVPGLGETTSSPFSVRSSALLSPAGPMSRAWQSTPAPSPIAQLPTVQRSAGSLALDPSALFTPSQPEPRRGLLAASTALAPPTLPPASASPAPNWPVTSGGDVILVLTQPRPVVRRSLLNDVCRLWDEIQT